ncbi:Putative peptidoglycan binding domain-containing protein [Mucilaginibacter sp. OK268]|uniref:peptidoglycan-binding domain-containing protein n=1 Tax=Mucilaginibacter sp. OK268 TaxID=1881048 RepID=UPI0008874170|nr:peptidoglycan-binding domain-containing protein [Mucilaginibacter sp. OK268]SDP96298.1 Putative peptidoglycan binding domain-containing protein [Mucilaginibacter sp. OK268]
MVKKQYLKEIVITATQQRGGSTNTVKDVMKVQSWLNLYAMVNPSAGTATGIDGDFGPATQTAVKAFQQAKSLPQTGIVDAALFTELSKPMLNAFTGNIAGTDLRTLVVNTAFQHLNNAPYELTIKGQSNSGPWVRSYMDGMEGTPWFWCMGFVQTILDQAASKLGKDFRTLMPLSYSCDTVATTGIQKGCLSRYATVRSNPSIVKPGDIFLLQKTTFDWIHTGLITAVHGDVFETIEGNTNNDGSSNGNGVYKRVRNFQTSKLDVFSIQGLV